jgi:hypothetical protein
MTLTLLFVAFAFDAEIARRKASSNLFVWSVDNTTPYLTTLPRRGGSRV